MWGNKGHGYTLNKKIVDRRKEEKEERVSEAARKFSQGAVKSLAGMHAGLATRIAHQSFLRNTTPATKSAKIQPADFAHTMGLVLYSMLFLQSKYAPKYC
jgi:hypothetical protein